MCLLLIVTSLLAFSVLYQGKALFASVVTLTAVTNKPSYYIREPVALSGTILEGGLPATNYLASVEVDNQRGTPLLFRTIPIGNPAPTPPQPWQVQVTAVYVKNSTGTQTNSIPLNSAMSLYATLQNKLLTAYNVIVTGTVFDGNLIPVIAMWSSITMSSGQNQTVSWSIFVPEWAYSGKALAVVNVYDDLPKNGGTPLTPESRYVFYFTRNPLIQTPNSVLPVTDTSSPGQYGIAFRMPPDIFTVPGTYNAYATAISPASPYLRSTASTSFNLTQYASPPQAAFTYTPLQIYGGMTVTFDASSSSAEGPNATITQYEWTTSDGTHVVGASAILSHAFSTSGTYVVTLNVTNSAGLWSTTSKPVAVLPDFGPTANFTWTPPRISINRTVTFDASSSKVGWSSSIPGYAPIATYTWNFGDGTPVNATSNNTIQHVFALAGNYTVALTVTDSVSRTSLLSQLVQVTNRTLWDLNGDGKIDMRDIGISAKAFGSVPGNPLWNPIADITGIVPFVPDGKVDMRDVSLVARHFGELA